MREANRRRQRQTNQHQGLVPPPPPHPQTRSARTSRGRCPRVTRCPVGAGRTALSPRARAHCPAGRVMHPGDSGCVSTVHHSPASAAPSGALGSEGVSLVRRSVRGVTHCSAFGVGRGVPWSRPVPRAAAPCPSPCALLHVHRPPPDVPPPPPPSLLLMSVNPPPPPTPVDRVHCSRRGLQTHGCHVHLCHPLKRGAPRAPCHTEPPKEALQRGASHAGGRAIV